MGFFKTANDPYKGKHASVSIDQPVVPPSAVGTIRKMAEEQDSLFDPGPFEGHSQDEFFGDIDQTDVVDNIPLQLIEDVRYAYNASDDRMVADAVKYLLLWVDTH